MLYSELWQGGFYSENSVGGKRGTDLLRVRASGKQELLQKSEFQRLSVYGRGFLLFVFANLHESTLGFVKLIVSLVIISSLIFGKF